MSTTSHETTILVSITDGRPLAAAVTADTVSFAGDDALVADALKANATTEAAARAALLAPSGAVMVISPEIDTEDADDVEEVL